MKKLTAKTSVKVTAKPTSLEVATVILKTKSLEVITEIAKPASLEVTIVNSNGDISDNNKHQKQFSEGDKSNNNSEILVKITTVTTNR